MVRALQVRLSDLAEQELYRIAWFIAQDSPAHAHRFLQTMYAKFESIGLNPLIYRLRPELGQDIKGLHRRTAPDHVSNH